MKTGHLKQIVMMALTRESITGYQLMSHIKNKTGWKPSPGSIYPLLENLAKEKLITFKSEGKRKIYSITKKGRQLFSEIIVQREELIQKMIQVAKTYGTLLSCDNSLLMEEVQKQLKQGKVPFEPIIQESSRTKSIIARISRQGKLEKNAEKINRILAKANAELEKIR